MKAEFIEPFLQASIHVFVTMANLSPTPGKPELKVDDQAKGDIMGIIGFTGPAEGSLSITFSEACAVTVATFMTGEKYDGLTGEAADAVGEVTNMISGDARARPQKFGYTFRASIPTIVQGEDHSVRHIIQGQPVIYIPFRTENGGFFVEACFSPIRERAYSGIGSFGFS